MNYLPPVNRLLYNADSEYAKQEIENILTQQIIISQLAKGISFEDTNNMDSYEINVNLTDALEFVQSELFNDFLLNNTTISNGLFISEVLTKTIRYMIEDVTDK